MASGSFQVNTSNQYVKGTLSWSSTTNQAGNYSSVYFELRFGRTNSGYTTTGSGDFQVYINGTPVTVTGKAFTYTQNSNTLVLSGTVNVPHNGDGSKQVLIEVDGNTNVHDVYYASSSPWLDTIPRASTFNGGIDFTAATDNFWISIDRKDASFHHTVQMFVQHTYDGAWDYIGQREWVGDSGWWNFTQAELTQIYTTMNAYENRPCLIRVYTYNSGHTAQIGDYQDKIGTVRAYATGQPSFNNFNIGTASVPASIVNYNANFTYDVTMYFGSFSKSWNNVGQNFNMTFVQADFDSMYSQIPNANSGVGEVVVRTKYNGVLIEDGLPVTNKKGFTAYVVNSNPVFSNFTYKDTNTALTTPITGNDQYIIQNKSTLVATITNANKAVGQNYAPVNKYVATVNGETITVNSPFPTDITFDFGTIDTSQSVNLVITAYDTRGNGTPVTKLVNVIPYAVPVVNASATRENGFGSNVSLTLSGSISPLDVNGVKKNGLIATGVNYKYRQLPSGAWSANIQFLGQTLTTPAYTYTTTGVALTMDTTLPFEIVVQVTDKLGNTTVTLPVNVGTPIMFVDEVKKSVGIGQFPTKDNSLEIYGAEVISTGGKSVPNDNLDTCYKSGTYRYSPTTTGRPSNGYGIVQVIVSDGVDFNATNNWLFQIAYSTDNPTYCFVRSRINAGAWYPWKRTNGFMNSDGSAFYMADNTDFNTIQDTGIYRLTSNTNSPPKSSSNPDRWWYLEVIKHDGGWILQRATDYRDGVYIRRRHNSSTWDAWRRISDDRRQIFSIWAGNQPLAANTWYRVQGDGGLNEGGMWNESNNLFTPNESGYYEIQMWTYFVQSIDTGFYMEVWSTTDAGYSHASLIGTWAPDNGYNYYASHLVTYLTAGQSYEFVIKHSDGSYTRNILHMIITCKRI